MDRSDRTRAADDPCGEPRRVRRRMVNSAGFSLVEAVIAVAIVGGMLMAALNTVGASRAGYYKIGLQQQGHVLAQALASEILAQSYEDPTAGAIVLFGPEAGETLGVGRSNFDDVDDYHNWTASPPQEKDGTALTEYAGWTRGVQVQWVNASNLTQTVASASGVKRITVTVSHGDVPVASVVVFRTSAWQTPGLE